MSNGTLSYKPDGNLCVSKSVQKVEGGREGLSAVLDDNSVLASSLGTF